MLYSPNGVEWYRPDQLANQPLARYIRLVNESNVTQTLGASELNVATKEITAPSLVSTTFGVDSYYGNNDARNLDDLSRLLDGSFAKSVFFIDYPRKDDEVIISLGSKRSIHYSSGNKITTNNTN